MTGPTPRTRSLVWERDAGACARCGVTIGGEWSLHHRIPRGSGGTRRPEINGAANLLLLCGSGVTGCHGAVESHRDEARRTGYLITALVPIDPADVPVLYRGEAWVRLDHHGGLTTHAHLDTEGATP